jgi:hypothetical protein
MARLGTEVSVLSILPYHLLLIFDRFLTDGFPYLLFAYVKPGEISFIPNLFNAPERPGESAAFCVSPPQAGTSKTSARRKSVAEVRERGWKVK